LGVDGHFGDFVQEQRAAFGLLEEAFAIHVGAGEGAFDGAEELAFDQFAGQGGAVDLDERAFAAGAEVVDEVGDDFLAGAAFAGDEDGDVAGGDFFDGADDGFHGHALENGGGAAAHGGEGFAQGTGLFVEAFVFEGALDGEEEGLGVEGLVLEMVGAALGGFDGGIKGGVAGEDDDFGVGPLLFYLGQEFQAVAVRAAPGPEG
jgi:hypothetical protein